MSTERHDDRYRGIINYDKPQDGKSSVSFTSNDIEGLKMLCRQQAGYHPCTVIIEENKAEHPLSDWQMLERYHLNKWGGARRGAGRKPLGKQSVTIQIDPEVHDLIKAMASERDTHKGDIIERAVRMFAERLK